MEVNNNRLKDTLILMASSRANGNTGRLARQVAKDIKAPIIDINDFEIRPYCYDNLNQNDGFMELIDLCLSYQQIVFASPVYWYGPTAQLKLFFDRITDLLDAHKDKGRQLRTKQVGLLATGYDVTPKPCFEQVFSYTFDYLGMDYRGMLYVPFQEQIGVDNYLPQIRQYSQKLMSAPK